MNGPEIFESSIDQVPDAEQAEVDAGWLGMFSKAAEIAADNPDGFNTMIADFNAGKVTVNESEAANITLDRAETTKKAA